MLMLLLHRHTSLRQPVFVRCAPISSISAPLGVAVNLLVGGGRMFPPFFREPAEADFNKWALERVVDELRRGQVLVGFHPEGTRNKNDSTVSSAAGAARRR